MNNLYQNQNMMNRQSSRAIQWLYTLLLPGVLFLLPYAGYSQCPTGLVISPAAPTAIGAGSTASFSATSTYPVKAVAQSNTSIGIANNALGPLDGLLASFDNNSDILQLDLGETLLAGTVLTLTMRSSANGSVFVAESNVALAGPYSTNTTIAISGGTVGSVLAPYTYTLLNPARYIRVQKSIGTLGTGLLYFDGISTVIPSAMTWTVSPTTGVSPASGTGSSTGAITFANAGIYTIQFTANGSNLTCSLNSKVFQQVNCADFSIAPIAVGGSYCIGEPISPLSVVKTGAASVTYQWYKNTTNSYTGAVPISGATGSSYTPAYSVGTAYYYVVASSGSCSMTSNISTIVSGTCTTSCGFAGNDGCTTTNYSNAYMSSTSNAATIEYDNMVRGAYQSAIRTANGEWIVWGQGMSYTGGNALSPLLLNGANYPALYSASGTKKVLKVTMANIRTTESQFIVLANDGLYAGGSQEGLIINEELTSSTGLQKLTIDGQADGLPAGVNPADVKMMHAAMSSLIITTCSGDVWVLSQREATRGQGGGVNSATAWYKVKTDATTYLTGIVAARVIGAGAVIALKADGTLWTWGYSAYLGNGTPDGDLVYATQMQSPVGTPKMVGITHGDLTYGVTYYVLMTNGNLYSLGANSGSQLGDWNIGNNTNSNIWKQPRYTSETGPVMDNIKWISPTEHEGDGNGTASPGISVLTNDGNLYAWGKVGSGLGLGWVANLNVDPTLVMSNVLAVETGGVSSIVIKQGECNFGFTGSQAVGSKGDGTTDQQVYDSYTFATFPINVCAAASVSVSTPVGSTYCSSGTVQLTGTPSGGTWAIQSGTTGTVSSSGLVTFSGVGSVVVRYTGPTASSCSANYADITLTSEICCTIGAASATPTVCEDAAMTAITHATTGVTGIVSSTGLPAGVTASYASDVLTISGTPTETGTFNYSITLTGGCITPATGTITVQNCTSGTIDCAKTQLYPSPVVGQSGQKMLLVTVNVTVAGCFSPLTVSGSGMTLANNITELCTSTTGVQQLAIPVYYNGSTLGTMNFSVGSAGSCSADLTVPVKKAICDIWSLDCVPTVGPKLK